MLEKAEWGGRCNVLSMTLLEALQSVPDYRKARGKRVMLVTAVMGTWQAIRGIAH